MSKNTYKRRSRIKTKHATKLIAENHTEEEELEKHAEQDGICCFCGNNETGVPAEDAISQKYFTNYDLMQKQTGHVCQYCAYCMSTRELKTGHWLATENTYESISTGDIYETLEQVANGEFEPPVTVYISENVIKAQHSYLWTPVVETNDPLVLSYASQTVRINWEEFAKLVEDIEELRACGFRLKDIKSGEPRVNDLENIGVAEYRKIEANISQYRGGIAFELALTASQKP